MSLRRWVPWFWAVVVAAVSFHAGILWWHDRLAPDTDILALLPAQQRDPARQRALAQMVEAAQQRVIVLIGAADWDDARRAATVYRKTLAPYRHLLYAAETISDRTGSDWLATFKNHRLTLLTSEDDAALRGQAPSYWLDRALAKLYSPFAAPQPLAWQEDPFGLFNNWLLARAQETPVRPRDRELSVSAGERHYVVLPLTLRVPAFAVAGQQALMPVLEQARQAAQQADPAGRDHSGRCRLACCRRGGPSAARNVHHRHRFAYRDLAVDLDYLSLIQADCLGDAVDRRRLPGRVVDFLARVRADSSDHFGFRRQLDRRGAGLRHLFFLQTARGERRGRFLAFAAANSAGADFDPGHYADRLFQFGPDAVSRPAPDGAVFRRRTDLRLVHCGVLVSNFGPCKFAEKSCRRGTLWPELDALAALCEEPAQPRRRTGVCRLGRLRRVAVDRARRHSLTAESTQAIAR